MTDSAKAVRSTGVSRWLGRLDRIGLLAENTLLILVLASMLGIAVWQIFSRNVFSGGFFWADEYLRLAVLWVAFIGSIAAARDHRHLRIDLLSRLLPASFTRWTDFIADLATVVVCMILAWYSLQFVSESFEYKDQAFGKLPLWWFQSILPVDFLLIGFRYAVWAMKRLTNSPSPDTGTETAT